MKGLNWGNPLRIRSAALTAWVQEIGFLPFFANARRLGWGFDGKWQDGRASNREKSIMEHFMNGILVELLKHHRTKLVQIL